MLRRAQSYYNNVRPEGQCWWLERLCSTIKIAVTDRKRKHHDTHNNTTNSVRVTVLRKVNGDVAAQAFCRLHLRQIKEQ